MSKSLYTGLSGLPGGLPLRCTTIAGRRRVEANGASANVVGEAFASAENWSKKGAKHIGLPSRIRHQDHQRSAAGDPPAPSTVMKPTRLTGLIAAPFTPFKADFSLNLDVVPRIAEHLVKNKVSGAFIGGTTGESGSLSLEERIKLTTAWRQAAGPELKLIVHVGHTCLGDSQEIARHAESVGADCIAAIMRAIAPPTTVEPCVDFCRRIAEAAPKTPFFYYHMPDVTRSTLAMADFLPAAAKSIPTFQGIKFTHSNLMDYGLTVAAAGDRFDILFGRDEFLLAGLAFGAKGAVGSTYNYSAALYHKLIQLHSSGKRDEATRQQVYIQQTVLPMAKFGGLSAAKVIMAMLGVDCGPPRPPLETLPPKHVAALKKELDALDFFAAVGK
jgi:N-acetylneuraminate lyase